MFESLLTKDCSRSDNIVGRLSDGALLDGATGVEDDDAQEFPLGEDAYRVEHEKSFAEDAIVLPGTSVKEVHHVEPLEGAHQQVEHQIVPVVVKEEAHVGAFLKVEEHLWLQPLVKGKHA